MAVAAINYMLHSPDATRCYAKWEQLPDDGNRYEVIDGVLYMTTVVESRHQRVIVGLLREVGNPIEAVGKAIGILGPIPVVMSGCDPVQPDFLLLRTERTSIIASDGYIHGVPDLIVEVLSPSYAQLDTVTKRAAYARAGVPEYWIARPASRDVLVCSQPDAALSDYVNVRLFESDAQITSPTLPIQVAVSDLFEPSPNG